MRPWSFNDTSAGRSIWYRLSLYQIAKLSVPYCSRVEAVEKNDRVQI